MRERERGGGDQGQLYRRLRGQRRHRQSERKRGRERGGDQGQLFRRLRGQRRHRQSERKRGRERERRIRVSPAGD